MTNLRITVTMKEKNPADITPGPPLALGVEASWLVDDTPMPCTDAALVMSLLEQARVVVMQGVPWQPPRVVTMPDAVGH